MKTIRTIILAALGLAAAMTVSCSKEEGATAQNERGTISVSVNGMLGEYSQKDETKAELVSNIRVKWQAGDKVYAFDGATCLGDLTVYLKDGKDYYALLTGELNAPQGGTKKITLVYATGFSAAEGAEMSSVSVDLSSQTANNSPKDSPFVAYGTIAYESGIPFLTNQIVDFGFATSIMRLNCSGLEADAAISGAKLTGFSNQCVLNITKTGASIGQGKSGNIVLSPAEGFKANDKGARSIYASIAKNGTAAEQTLEVKQTKTYEFNFGSQSRSAGQSINAICPASEKILPYVVIPAKYDGTNVTDLKWYRQNLAISESGNKTWKPGGSAVKVPGTDWNVINGDYFQWAVYAGYCGNETDADKGLLIYESFTSKMFGDGSNAFTFKSPEDGKTYRFYTSSSSTSVGISPYYSGSAYTKYTSGDVNLEKKDDVATIILDGSWRMPTSAEFQAMKDATYWAWDATDKGYYVFTPGQGTSGSAGDRGTIAGTDDKTKALLFFPAAGLGDNTTLYAGSRGNYWSSSLYSSDPRYAYTLYFISSDVIPQSYNYRFSGFTVRPVSD